MKLLLVSDIHFGVKSSVDGNSGNKKIGDLFLHKTFEVLDSMFNKHKPNIDAIAILGDVYDKRISSDNKVLFETIQFFEKHRDITIYILIGNHDCYFNNTNEYNTVMHLSLIFPNIILVPEESLELDDVLMVNWVNDSNREMLLEKIQNSKKKYLFGHFDVIGANLGSGRLSTKGFDKKSFPQFTQVFTGHYHTQSEIENIVYLGNPIQTKMSEHDEDKGVVILDTDSGEWYRDNYPLKMFYKVNYDSLLDFKPDEFVDMFNEKVVELTIDRSSVNYKVEEHERIVDNIRSVASSISVIIKNVVRTEENEVKIPVDITDGKNLLENELDRFQFDDTVKDYVYDLFQKSKDELGE